MNIVFISNGYNSSKIGGGDMHANLFANYLSDHGEKVSVCLPEDAVPNFFREKINLIRYRNIPFERIFHKNNLLLFFLYILRSFCSAYKIKSINEGIFISTSHLFNDTLPLLFLSSKNRKFVVYIHHIISQQSRTGFSAVIVNLLEKISFLIIKYKKASIITVSDEVSNQLINIYFFQKTKISLSSNGIDLSTIKYSSAHIKKYDLVFCGRLVEVKGILEFVNFVHKIRNDISEISCAIIGSGPLEYTLLKMIKKFDLEKNINILGYVSEEAKIDILQASKIFILPSHEEGWGIVIGEAMACGVPVVTYKLPEIVSVWKDSVLWVKPYNIDEFILKIESLLQSDSLRARMSQYGLEYIKKYSLNDVFLKETQLIKNS